MAANREPEGKSSAGGKGGRETTQSKLLLLLNAKHAYRSSPLTPPPSPFSLPPSKPQLCWLNSGIINRQSCEEALHPATFDVRCLLRYLRNGSTSYNLPPSNSPFPRWAPFVFALCARAQRHIRYKDLKLLLSCQRRRHGVYKTVTVKVTVTVTVTATVTVTETKTVTRNGML